MTGRGRPLRFVALVMLGWIGARIAMLWPAGEPLPIGGRAFATARGDRPQPSRAASALANAPGAVESIRGFPAQAFATFVSPPIAAPGTAIGKGAPAVAALFPLDPVRLPAEVAPLPHPAPRPPDHIAPLPDRWSASAWASFRPGVGLGAAPDGGQLGGSQMGVRLAYMVAPSARVALFGRVAAPLRGPGSEAAIGAEWQPTAVPVRLIVEQRFGLDGTRGGPGAGVVAGGDVPLPAGFRLETYGQAGAVYRDRIEPYADGAARVTHVVAAPGPARLALGAGAWGAAQRDASRLDLGPSATLAFPLSGANLRLALDWRQRVAGGARPGSGFALTLGSDF